MHTQATHSASRASGSHSLGTGLSGLGCSPSDAASWNVLGSVSAQGYAFGTQLRNGPRQIRRCCRPSPHERKKPLRIHCHLHGLFRRGGSCSVARNIRTGRFRSLGGLRSNAPEEASGPADYPPSERASPRSLRPAGVGFQPVRPTTEYNGTPVRRKGETAHRIFLNVAPYAANARLRAMGFITLSLTAVICQLQQPSEQVPMCLYIPRYQPKSFLAVRHCVPGQYHHGRMGSRPTAYSR